MTSSRAAAAGATAALVWAAVEPLDTRLFGCDYSDIALLGKAVTRRRWRTAGLVMHAANGAVFGLAFRAAQRRTGWPVRSFALSAALAEHLVLYPLNIVVDRVHPARGEPGLPLLATNQRAFALATFRHALFGFVLGRLAE